jgi:hypothetical protein
MTLRPSLPRLGVVCVLVSLATLAAVGCGNPTKPAAAIAIAYDTLTAYALNQANPFEPTAFDLATNELVVPDGNAAFDFAFGLDSYGNVIVYPAKLIVSVVTATRTVGLQLMYVSFNSITIAAHSGYEFNDSLLVAPHQTFEVVTQNLTACTAVNITSQELLYGKFEIDSVNADSGQIFFRAVVDPNCDYDTLVPGVVPSH